MTDPLFLRMTSRTGATEVVNLMYVSRIRKVTFKDNTIGTEIKLADGKVVHVSDDVGELLDALGKYCWLHFLPRITPVGNAALPR